MNVEGLFVLAFRRCFREFTEFFFWKGNALSLALTKDLVMPLVNPIGRAAEGRGPRLKVLQLILKRDRLYRSILFGSGVAQQGCSS